MHLNEQGFCAWVCVVMVLIHDTYQGYLAYPGILNGVRRMGPYWFITKTSCCGLNLNFEADLNLCLRVLPTTTQPITLVFYKTNTWPFPFYLKSHSPLAFLFIHSTISFLSLFPFYAGSLFSIIKANSTIKLTCSKINSNHFLLSFPSPFLNDRWEFMQVMHEP